MQTAPIHREICHLTHKAMLLPQAGCIGTLIRSLIEKKAVGIRLTLPRTALFSEPDHATM